MVGNSLTEIIKKGVVTNHYPTLKEDSDDFKKFVYNEIILNKLSLIYKNHILIKPYITLGWADPRSFL